MSYTPLLWVAGVTPLSAINLNGLEDGLEEFGVPSGLIALWHGTIANIPSGWLICDGNNGTPNLLAKFVQGVATAATNPGATGGSATTTLTTTELPAHTHTINELDGLGGSERFQHDSVGGGVSNTITSNTNGTGSAFSNEPAFYDVAFLMKS